MFLPFFCLKNLFYRHRYSSLREQNMKKLTSELWKAMLNGEYDMANHLICSGANVNEPRNTDFDPLTTLLHIATMKKDGQCVRLLINHGANCHARDSQNRTPLHWATMFEDRPDVVEALINGGAIVDARSVHQFTPFLLAVMHNCHQSAEMLVARGASIVAVNADGWSALHYAATFRDLRMMKMLISHELINIDAEERKRRITPLHCAVMRGNTDNACLLLDNGADLNKTQKNGYTPLYLAACRDYPTTVHFLLKRGARINEVTDKGNTALHKAIKYEFVDVAALLVKYGADMNVPNYEDKTALQLLLPSRPSIEPIARIIIHEAVKREALGQPICLGYRKMAQSCEKYSKFDRECREEIKRMGSETIDVDDSAVSFFYIFSTNETKLAALARNKNFVTAFKTSNYLTLFRIYDYDLITKFEKACRRAKFVMSVEDCLVAGLGDILPAPILKKLPEFVEYVKMVESRHVELWKDCD